MLRLRHDTPPRWARVALDNFNAFLQDHAANERKVSASALTLAAQHPHRTELVAALIDIAQEELAHFKRVFELLIARGQKLGFDAPDPYMTGLRDATRKRNVEGYLLDRLLVFSIVEARGCERFTLIEGALPDGDVKAFYGELVRSEARHHAVYIELAREIFAREVVDARLDELLDFEAQLARDLPLRPALH